MNSLYSSHSVYISNEVTFLKETHPLNKNNVTALVLMFRHDSVKVIYTNINSKIAVRFGYILAKQTFTYVNSPFLYLFIHLTDLLSTSHVPCL